MGKIKILVDGISADIGGIGAVIFNIVQNLDKDKFEADILFTYDSVYQPIAEKMGINAVKVTPFGQSISKYKSDLNKVFKEKNYDYVWVNNTGKVNIIIFELAKKYNVKTIAHSHGETQEYGLLKRIVFSIIEKFNENKFYKLLDIAISCSNNSAEYFYNKSKLKGKPIYILENAVMLDRFAFDNDKRQEYRKQWGVKDEIVVGTVGRLCEVKNQSFLIEVFKLLECKSRFKLIIIGDGVLKDKLNSLIQETNLQENVMLLGARNDVNKLLSAFDAFVLPSFNEGYSVSVVEAYANGLPCLVSNTVKNPNFEGIKFLDINNAQEWAKAIEELTIRQKNDRVLQMEAQGLGLTGMVKRFEDILIKYYK